MAEINLGRVQGGSCFYSPEVSEIEISNATLLPSSLQPLVGDAVIFENGDLRTVEEIKENSIVCSEVRANYCGRDGDSLVPENVITTDTAQTISGQKIFTSSGVQQILDPNVDALVNPDSVNYHMISMSDKEGRNLALLGCQQNATGAVDTFLRARTYTSAGQEQDAVMGISLDRSGNVRTFGPVPPSGDNSDKFATTSWVNSNSVKLTGDQTISGNKKFNSLYVGAHWNFRVGGTNEAELYVYYDNTIVGQFHYAGSSNNLFYLK